MYISSIAIENFRVFQEAEVRLRPNVNVIIGENNAGKTAVLDALGLIFNYHHRRRPTVWDFWRGIDFETREQSGEEPQPPQIRVKATLQSSGDDESTEKAIVATWLTELEEPWQATLTYLFYLPEKHHEQYFDALAEAEEDRKSKFGVLEDFLPKYKSRVYGGEPTSRKRAEPEYLSKFDFRFIDAIRDAESELFSGRNPLLKSMLKEVLHEEDEDGTFRSAAQDVHDNVEQRLDTDELFDLVDKTGAQDGGKLDIDGDLTEEDVLDALRLHITNRGFEVPIDRNGLGYNNLIYIALVLAQMKRDADDSVHGENASAFPMLVLEEPEAHLHPALQSKLLQYIQQESESSSGTDTRQVFFTTHSSHITSASSLENIICLTAPDEEEAQPQVAYPGQAYEGVDDGNQKRRHVERHLDATKSSMLFAKGVIFVEGVTEQLILPRLAELHLDGETLADHHVEVVAVGGSTFRNFVPLFGAASRDEDALDRPVACIVDRDPARKKHDKAGANWEKCYPYRLHADDEYEPRPKSPVVDNLENHASGRVQVFRSGQMTLEYDLAYNNSEVEILVNDSCSHQELLEAGNQGDLKKVIKKRDDGEEVLRDLDAHADGDDLEKHLFATALLRCVGDDKGEYIYRLVNDLASVEPANFNVPKYISEAIDHVIRNSG